MNRKTVFWLMIGLAVVAAILLIHAPLQSPNTLEERTPMQLGTPLSTPDHYCGSGPIERYYPVPVTIAGKYIRYAQLSTQDLMKSDQVRSLLVVPEGLLIGYAGQLANILQFFDGHWFETCQTDEVKVRSHVNGIAVEPNGDVWVCTDWNPDTGEGGGVYQFIRSQNTWIHYSTADGLPAEQCYAIKVIGFSGPIAVSTWEGIAFFQPNETTGQKGNWNFMESMQASDGPKNIHDFDTRTNVGPGDLHWYATIHNGFWRVWKEEGTDQIHYDNLTVENFPQLGSNKARKVVYDPAHNGLWWLIAEGGVATYDALTNTVQAVSDIPDSQGRDIQFDHYGRPWIATAVNVYYRDCGVWLPIFGSDIKDITIEPLTLAFGVDGGVFSQDTFFIGTNGQGIIQGQVPPSQDCS